MSVRPCASSQAESAHRADIAYQAGGSDSVKALRVLDVVVTHPSVVPGAQGTQLGKAAEARSREKLNKYRKWVLEDEQIVALIG